MYNIVMCCQRLLIGDNNNQSTHTNGDCALYFLHDEACDVVVLERLGCHHALEIVLALLVHLHPQGEEFSQDLLHRVVSLDDTIMVKQHL